MSIETQVNPFDKVFSMLHIFIDADGCPVKDEIYRVADRYKLKVTVVANKPLKIPLSPLVEMVVVHGNFDAADDWIAEKAEKNDIVITGDIPLADRCVKKNARVLGHKGHEFTPDNVGEAMASRELLIHLRQTGESKGGPSPIEKKDRSLFLSKMDQVIQSIRKEKG
jgi:uncharacterized protein YaiI (UPF0178 family)